MANIQHIPKTKQAPIKGPVQKMRDEIKTTIENGLGQRY
jgi:hypothetical protein